MIVFKSRRVKERSACNVWPKKATISTGSAVLRVSLNRRNGTTLVSHYTFSPPPCKPRDGHHSNSCCTLPAPFNPGDNNTGSRECRVHLPGWKSVLSLIPSQELTTFRWENTFAPGNCCARTRSGEKNEISLSIKRNQYSIHSASFIVRATLCLFCCFSLYVHLRIMMFHISWVSYERHIIEEVIVGYGNFGRVYFFSWKIVLRRGSRGAHLD
jgi:hypothetical protein